MMQEILTIDTHGVGFYDLTALLNAIIVKSSLKTGLVNVFIQHTSASLVITENADTNVQSDLENFMRKLAPEDAALYEHCDEGIDDMPSHIRSILTTSSLTIPISDTKLALGRWQGVYLWEHRHKPHQRRLVVSVYSI